MYGFPISLVKPRTTLPILLPVSASLSVESHATPVANHATLMYPTTTTTAPAAPTMRTKKSILMMPSYSLETAKMMTSNSIMSTNMTTITTIPMIITTTTITKIPMTTMTMVMTTTSLKPSQFPPNQVGRSRHHPYHHALSRRTKIPPKESKSRTKMTIPKLALRTQSLTRTVSKDDSSTCPYFRVRTWVLTATI